MQYMDMLLCKGYIVRLILLYECMLLYGYRGRVEVCKDSLALFDLYYIGDVVIMYLFNQLKWWIIV